MVQLKVNHLNPANEPAKILPHVHEKVKGFEQVFLKKFFS